MARVCGLLALVLLTLPDRLLAACDPGCGSADPCVVSSPIAVDDGCTIDVGTRELRIVSGGALTVGSGTMTLKSGTLTVQLGGVVSAFGNTTAAGGIINANAGDVVIAGTIDARGAPGGNITVTASGNLSLTGSVTASAPAGGSDNGGQVQLTAATATVSGTVSAVGGISDGVGGDLAVDAGGDVTVSGTLNSQGGEGGTGEVSTSAGNVMITNTAMLIADATEPGGLGGEIDVTVNGDGTTTGLATINGLLSVKGLSSTDTGGDGGCICIEAAGDIHIDQTSALVTADGGAPDGDAGEIDITSDNASLTMQGTLSASAGGTDSGGGTVAIETATDATVNGSILLIGGSTGGGEADVTSDSASVTIGAASMINVSSNLVGAGDGGVITLTSGSDSALPHAVLVAGKLIADGGPGGGNGGGIDLEGGDSVHVASTGSLHASGGGSGSGAGGTLMAIADPGIVSIEGPMTAEGGSPSGIGGVLTIDAGGQISLSAPLDAKGFGTGGMVGIGHTASATTTATTGPIDVFNITVASSTGAGGSIEIIDAGDISIAGTLVADGVMVASATPSIGIVGCNVTVCGMDATNCPAGSTGVLSSLGSLGVNQVTGRSSTAILGTMRADKNSGSNILIYHGAPEPAPLVLGSVTPTQTVNAVASVLPCPVCGDHIVEAPETCDDGNTNDGDGCSSMCQTEVGIPGDVNGDHAVTVDDLGYLVTEIFDGDGDSVTMVSGGSFPGTAGADANGDTVITAPDLTAVIKLLPAAP